MKTFTVILSASIATLCAAGPVSAYSFDSAYRETETRVIGGYGFDAGGDAYTVSDDGSQATRIRRVDASGTVVWSTSFPGHTLAASIVVVSGSRVAVATVMGDDPNDDDGLLVVRGFDRATGNAFPPVTVADDQTSARPVVGLQADGTITTLYADEGVLHRVQLPPSGPVIDKTIVGANVWFEEYTYFTATGTTLVGRSTQSAFEYVLLSPQGTVTRAFTEAALGLTSSFAQLAPDGSVFVVGVQSVPTVSNRSVAVKLAPNGQEAWRTTLREGATATARLPSTFGDGAVFLTISSGTNAAGDVLPPVTAYALDAATGAKRWEQDVPLARDGYFRNEVSDDGDVIIGVRTLFSNKIRVQARDTDDGALIYDREYDCGSSSCSGLLVDLDGDDRLRVIARNNPINANAAFTIDAATDRPGYTYTAEPHVRGVFNVKTNGQGIVLDQSGSAIFGTWFTMSYRASSQPQTTTIADQHWYTLQGQPPEDSTTASMTIYETSGGSFASGESIAPTAVGQATLSFDDCNHGTLVYSFDEGRNGGAQGIVSLERLVEATDDCFFFDAANQPHEVPVDDTRDGQGGLFLNYSGSWAHENSGGQGFELAIRPGQVIAGAWFTFDAGSADDPQHHHWYTLSGSLANATNGVATATLYETVGGTFDNREAPANATTAVGTVTFRFTDCEHATAEYTVPGATGTVALRHLGNCTASQ